MSDPTSLGGLGHKIEYDLDGAIVYVPLIWERGAIPTAAVAKSCLTDETGEHLEYWIEIKGRKVQLSADDELMRRKVETHPDAHTAAGRANQIERQHLAAAAAAPRLIPSAGESGRKTP